METPSRAADRHEHFKNAKVPTACGSPPGRTASAASKLANLKEKLALLSKEITMTHMVYPGKVGRGTCTQAQYDRRIELLQEMIQDYEADGRPNEIPPDRQTKLF